MRAGSCRSPEWPRLACRDRARSGSGRVHQSARAGHARARGRVARSGKTRGDRCRSPGRTATTHPVEVAAAPSTLPIETRPPRRGRTPPPRHPGRHPVAPSAYRGALAPRAARGSRRRARRPIAAAPPPPGTAPPRLPGGPRRDTERPRGAHVIQTHAEHATIPETAPPRSTPPPARRPASPRCAVRRPAQSTSPKSEEVPLARSHFRAPRQDVPDATRSCRFRERGRSARAPSAFELVRPIPPSQRDLRACRHCTRGVPGGRGLDPRRAAPRQPLLA